MKYLKANKLRKLFKSRREKVEEEVDEGYSTGEPGHSKPTWRCFSYEEISGATGSFSPGNFAGKGGYAEVYRGVLKDGREIAVKRLAKLCSDERKEKDFLSEIGTVGHVSHPNVMSLLGCCVDNGLYLIFHFSSNGSVASLLHDAKLPTLEWKTRHKIAVGAARGLNYLHKGCQRRIIHRDIKSSNILLSSEFEPMISDFGLAKWLPTHWSHYSIAPIEGSFGHLAPEYLTHGIVDEKTDVFAFGVFLLELISGRKPVDGTNQSLHNWARPILGKGEIRKVVDPKLNGAYDVVQLQNLAFAASLCIRLSPSWRPQMDDILEIMVKGKARGEKWEMPKEEEMGKWFALEELECDSDNSFSFSLYDSTSTTSS